MAEITPTPEASPVIDSYKAAPGTEILIDEDQNGYIHTLQHVTKGDGHVLLVPQPSLTDINDPLRWPTWKKWMVYINGLAYSFLGSNIGPIMSGGMTEQAAFFNIPISHLSWAAGISLLMGGVACLFWIPLSVKFGRRPVFLASSIISALGCIWCGVAAKTTFASFFVGRAFAGFASGPIEAIVPSLVTDIFFLHDRGEKISIYGLAVLGGNEIGPVLSAYIIMGIGMSWAFYIVAIALFVNFVTIFFCMPETAYYGARPSITFLAPGGRLESNTKEAETKVAVVDTLDTETSLIVPRQGYIPSLMPWSALNPDITLKKAFLRPFILIAYPTIIWASLVYGMALTWNVVLALTIAQLFAPPPYLFNTGAQGLIFLAPFVGSLIGTYLCGPLADKVAMEFTRRNNGIREPEMRLPVAAIAAFFTFAGVAIAAPCYNNETHWIGPIFGFGVLSIGSQMGANLSMTYALDSHKELSGELMVTISVIKSLFAWAWSWFINDWIISNGMMNVYFTVATINVVVYATTVIVYYKGKAIRIMIRDKNLFERTGLA